MLLKKIYYYFVVLCFISVSLYGKLVPAPIKSNPNMKRWELEKYDYEFIDNVIEDLANDISAMVVKWNQMVYSSNPKTRDEKWVSYTNYYSDKHIFVCSKVVTLDSLSNIYEYRLRADAIHHELYTRVDNLIKYLRDYYKDCLVSLSIGNNAYGMYLQGLGFPATTPFLSEDETLWVQSLEITVYWKYNRNGNYKPKLFIYPEFLSLLQKRE